MAVVGVRKQIDEPRLTPNLGENAHGQGERHGTDLHAGFAITGIEW